MKPIKNASRVAIFLLFQMLILWSCKDEKVTPPFPESENEYKQPQTKSFEISKTDTLSFTSRKLPPNASLPTKKINWNSIPSKPFDIATSYKTAPLPTKPLDWQALPRTDFNLDSLPEHEITIRTVVLGVPKVVQSGLPEAADNASRGVMTFDENFGYPGTMIYQIVDSDGMFWIGGNAGIARYDGERLELYGQEQGLKSKIIDAMIIDSKGRIWLADNFGGMFVIDLKSKLILELTIPGFIGANDIIETLDGKFWISSRTFGYDIIDLQEKLSRRFTPEQGLLDNKPTISAYQDHEGLIWLSTNKGVNIIDLKEKKNISFTKDHGLLKDFVVGLQEDSQHRMWIGTELGATIVDSSKSFVSYLMEPLGLKEDDIVSDMMEDKNGTFWIGTDLGTLFHYDESLSLMEKIVVKESKDFVGIWGLYEDKQGQIWIPTIRDGIFFLDPKGGRPGNYTSEDGLAGNEYWGTIHTNDGNSWMSGINGIDIYDAKKRTVKNLSKKDGLISDFNRSLLEDSKGRVWSFGMRTGVNIIDLKNNTIQQFASPENLDGNWVTALLEDSTGNLWLGGNLGELFFVDIKNQLLHKYVIDTIGERNMIDNLLEDDQNRIWISGRGLGIHILDPALNTRTKIGTKEGLVSDEVYAMYRDSHNLLWIATDKGVEFLDFENKQVSTFTISQGLATNDVYAIIERNDKILLGTSKGLTFLEDTFEAGDSIPFWRVNTIGKNQGLEYLDFAMNSFSIDKHGRFWAGVDRQIITVIDEIYEDTLTNPPQITGINVYDKKQEFYNTKLIKSSLNETDTLWAWELNDYVVKEKADLISSYETQNGIEWDTIQGAYDLPVNLKLPYNQNYISFNYSGQQFRNTDKVVYRYMLEGYDDQWREITKKNITSNYRDLAPGTYSFKVAAKGFNEVWSKPSAFSFTVMPALRWWQTWWAILIFAVLFLLLGVAILNYRSRWLKRENRILEDKVNERTSELKKTISELQNTQSQLIQSEKMASLGELTAGIAHEIQNPMNFINNFSEVTTELVGEMCEELDKGELEEAKDISKDIVQNLEKISHHGKRASSIVRGMLEHSRNNSGHKEFIDINVLADEYLRLAYHGLRAKDKSFNADFQTDFDDTLPKVEIMPQDLGRVVLNIINNAFFAVTSIPENERDANYKPVVKVTTKNLGDQVMISIKDNGPGIPTELKDKIFQPFFTTKPAGKGTGLGLSLAYDIVTTGHGGAIELNTAPGEGTEFVIYIPIRK